MANRGNSVLWFINFTVFLGQANRGLYWQKAQIHRNTCSEVKQWQQLDRFVEVCLFFYLFATKNLALIFLWYLVLCISELCGYLQNVNAYKYVMTSQHQFQK
jgi:hypothetical protein